MSYHFLISELISLRNLNYAVQNEDSAITFRVKHKDILDDSQDKAKPDISISHDRGPPWFLNRNAVLSMEHYSQPEPDQRVSDS